MELDLTDFERRVLVEVLRDAMGDLKAEINRTETRAFKEELKAREEVLNGVLTRLGAAPSAEPI
jgi:hypothetical protein